MPSKPDFDPWALPGAFACRCPFADFDDESKCCRTSMTREKAVERFTATFGRAPQEHELPERLQIGRQR